MTKKSIIKIVKFGRHCVVRTTGQGVKSGAHTRPDRQMRLATQNAKTQNANTEKRRICRKNN